MPVPDMGAIASLFGSLNTATEIVKSFMGLRDTSMVQNKVIELQTTILSAQSSAFAANATQAALLEEVRSLKEEVTRLKTWEAEKQRYRMTTVGNSLVAYALKEGMESGEPPHHLCARCYEEGQKSILQTEHRQPGRAEVLVCHRCGSELYVRGFMVSQHQSYRRGR